jgi:4,5-DOPA dioxygenase extradiol
VRDFAGWMAGELTAGHIDRLLDYRCLAPEAERNHPTEEHLLPLFFACGAAAGPLAARRVYEGYSYGLLAMDAWAFGEGAAATGPC